MSYKRIYDLMMRGDRAAAKDNKWLDPPPFGRGRSYDPYGQSDESNPTTKHLPLEGAELVYLCLFGNPKRAELRARFADGRALWMPVSSARTRIRTSGAVAVETDEHGDIEMYVTYRALRGHRLLITKARVIFSGTAEEWKAEVKAYLDPSPFEPGPSWAVDEAHFDLRTEPVEATTRPICSKLC